MQCGFDVCNVSSLTSIQFYLQINWCKEQNRITYLVLDALKRLLDLACRSVVDI